MKSWELYLIGLLMVFQADKELDPAETYNFIIVLLGILLLIIILAYILLTSKEE